ncbi:MAG TPA: CPBP family intramembrane glutamic endopeptidase [Planctomycetota bacterium]
MLGLAFIALFFTEGWLRWSLEGENFIASTFGIQWIATPAVLAQFGSRSLGDTQAYNGFANSVCCAAYASSALLLLAFLAGLWGKEPIRDCLAGFGRKNVWLHIGAVALICILGAKLIELLGFYSGDPARPGRVVPAWAAVALFLTPKIVGPILEEVVFRFGVFRFMRRRLSFWIAAALSSVLFGLAHARYPDPAKIGLAALAGLLFAWSYERTGTLVTPIAIHMCSNLLTL